MNLAQTIKDTALNKGEIALFWLGQAGFLIKGSSGVTIAVDPYLSDCGYRMKDYDAEFKRISPVLIDPSELDVDLYLISHHHFDHYDFDTVPTVAKRENVVFCGPSGVQSFLEKDGVPAERRIVLDRGMSTSYKGIEVSATLADHGEMAPDAIGAIVQVDGVKVWFAGDTCYREDVFSEVATQKPDVAVLPVNGAFGNLTAEEGAMAAGAVGARIAVPCHFWTFMKHRGEPWLFAPKLNEIAPECTPAYMRQGECITIKSVG